MTTFSNKKELTMHSYPAILCLLGAGGVCLLEVTNENKVFCLLVCLLASVVTFYCICWRRFEEVTFAEDCMKFSYLNKNGCTNIRYAKMNEMRFVPIGRSDYNGWAMIVYYERDGERKRKYFSLTYSEVYSICRLLDESDIPLAGKENFLAEILGTKDLGERVERQRKLDKKTVFVDVQMWVVMSLFPIFFLVWVFFL